MTQRETTAVRRPGQAHLVPDIRDDEVVPYYLQEHKTRVSVARVDGRLYAFDDLCSCAAPPCPLSGGLLIGTTLTCQCHGSEFDIATGAVVRGPATQPLRVHRVQPVEDGYAIVHFNEDAPHAGASRDAGSDDRSTRRLARAALVIMALTLPIWKSQVKRHRGARIGRA